MPEISSFRGDSNDCAAVSRRGHRQPVAAAHPQGHRDSDRQRQGRGGRLPVGAGARDRPRCRSAGRAWPQGRHRRRVRPHLVVRLFLRRPRRLSPGTLAVPLPRHRRRQLRMADLCRGRSDPSPRADHAGRIPAREEVHQDRAAQGDAADTQRLPLLPLHPALRSEGLRPAALLRRPGCGVSQRACRACPGRLHLRADGRGAGGHAVRSAGARAGQGRGRRSRQASGPLCRRDAAHPRGPSVRS